MRLRIDKAGRVVLPKPVRDRLGIQAGMDLELTEVADGLVLKPVRKSPSLVDRNGLLVHRGKLPKASDWSRLIEDDRDERMRKLAGGYHRFRGPDVPAPYSANSALAP